MKLKNLSLFLLLVATSGASAQITYRDTEKKPTKPTLIPYDSSIAFQHLTADIAQLTLVGQEITFLKLNPKRLAKNKEDSLLDNIKLKSMVEVPYKGVLRGGHFYTPYKAVENKTFKIVDYDRKHNEDGSTLLIFTLWDADHKTVLYQVDADHLSTTPVIINGNYEWLKKKYIGQKLYVRKGSKINYKTENLLDNNKEITLDETEEFSCTDIAVIFAGQQKYGQPYIIAKSNVNGEIAIGVGNRSEYTKGPLVENLWTEKEREAYLSEQKK
ncbi:hypothetical protein CLV51_103453 [Chitinophaga niastensis]|uniref:DKNYY family protein n=1 Tax=Chitinophaga niastensis TaxID=536980 RepID=A0A2P8HJT1_CHINA|nr:hypothetical protein [Chitinophaga niastensis]PSL46474.1 hypothetical protein CLV51_103453 [Chitinophaga niastensis]